MSKHSDKNKKNEYDRKNTILVTRERLMSKKKLK